MLFIARSLLSPSRLLYTRMVSVASERSLGLFESVMLICCLGYPHPENQRLASRLESIVRENGAVPATIGILNGSAHVGMSESQIAELLEKSDLRKVSRRDIAFATG